MHELSVGSVFAGHGPRASSPQRDSRAGASNVLIGGEGKEDQSYLTDFGLPKRVASDPR
jgi:hypothetical protein